MQSRERALETQIKKKNTKSKRDNGDRQMKRGRGKKRRKKKINRVFLAKLYEISPDLQISHFLYTS